MMIFSKKCAAIMLFAAGMTLLFSCQKDALRSKNDAKSANSCEDMKRNIQNDDQTRKHEAFMMNEFSRINTSRLPVKDRQRIFGEQVKERTTHYQNAMIQAYPSLASLSTEDQMKMIFNVDRSKCDEEISKWKESQTGRSDECDALYDLILAVTYIEIFFEVDLTTDLWSVYHKNC